MQPLRLLLPLTCAAALLPAGLAAAEPLDEGQMEAAVQEVVPGLREALSSGQATLADVQDQLKQLDQIAERAADPDAGYAAQPHFLRSQVLAMIGETERALDILEPLRSHESAEVADGAYALSAKTLADAGKVEQIEALQQEAKDAGRDQQLLTYLSSLTTQANMAVGKTFPPFSFTSLSGETVDLEEYRGKVVLVDFWATWCGPCVHEMPTVIAAYEKYHDQGFEVIGISLDQEESELRDFINERNMPWPQHFDGQGWKNDLAQKYGIQSIPATFLIGPEGKIVAKDLRGPALEAELKKYLSDG